MNKILLKLLCILLFTTLGIAESQITNAPTVPTSPISAQQQYQDNVAQYVSGVMPYSPPTGYQYQEPNYGPQPDQAYENYLMPYPQKGVQDQDDYDDSSLSSYQYLSSIIPYARIIYRLLVKAGFVVLGGAVLLAVGGLLTTAICTFTPFCTIQFNGLGINRESMRSLMTPDNLSLASTFIHDAIERYHKLNSNKRQAS